MQGMDTCRSNIGTSRTFDLEAKWKVGLEAGLCHKHEQSPVPQPELLDLKILS